MIGDDIANAQGKLATVVQRVRDDDLIDAFVDLLAAQSLLLRAQDDLVQRIAHQWRRKT